MELQPNVWRVRIGGTEYPAPDVETLREWAQLGRLGRDDSVWDPRVSKWKLSREITELRNLYYPPFLFGARWKFDAFLAIWPLYFVALALLGVLLLSASISGQLAGTLRALLWSSTEGSIIRSTVSPVTVPDPSGTITFYRAEIVYEYHVFGRTYQSTRLQMDNSLPDLYSDRQHAEQRTAPYRPGDSVVVYFDPRNPQTATLDRNEENILLFCIGLPLTVISAYVLRVWWRKRLSRQSALPSAGSTPSFCTHCGCPLKAGVAFCSGCGAPVKPSVIT